MEEEVREIKRARRVKSLQRMVTWLEAQDRANAEEGSPRADGEGKDQEGTPLILLVVRPSFVVASVEEEENVVSPEERDQRLITSCVRSVKGVCDGRRNEEGKIGPVSLFPCHELPDRPHMSLRSSSPR